MNTKINRDNEGSPLSTRWIVVILVICALPSAFRFISAAMGLQPWIIPPDASSAFMISTGQLILQTAGFSVALIVSALCIAHFARAGDLTTSLLGLGMHCAGMLGLWQTLMAGGIFTIQTPLDVFVPFSWTMSRGFYAVILITSINCFLFSGKVQGDQNRMATVKFIGWTCLVLAILGSAAIYMAAQKPDLVHYLYGGTAGRIVWNFAPLLMLVFTGLYVLPLFFIRHRTIFTQSLALSCVVLSLAHLHFLLDPGMRDHLPDMLTLAGYTLPLIGLLFDYQATYHRFDKLCKALRAEIMQVAQVQGASSGQQNMVDALLEAINQPVYVVDSSLRIMRVNKSFSDLARLASPQAAVGKTHEDLFDAGLSAAQKNLCRKVLETNTRAENPASAAFYPDRQWQNIGWLHMPIRDNQGQILAILCVGQANQNGEVNETPQYTKRYIDGSLSIK